MSPNHATQLTGFARHAGCYRPADPPAASAPRSHQRWLILFSLDRNAVAGPLDTKDAVVALAELPTPTGWCHAK